MRHASKAPLLHLFNDHSHCNESWCLAKVAEREGKVYVSKDGPYLDKEINKTEYEQLKAVCDRFSTDERLMESLHSGDTQANESLNMSLTFFAPKKSIIPIRQV